MSNDGPNVSGFRVSDNELPLLAAYVAKHIFHTVEKEVGVVVSNFKHRLR